MIAITNQTKLCLTKNTPTHPVGDGEKEWQEAGKEGGRDPKESS